VGETQNHSFQLSFNPSLKVDFQGSSRHLRRQFAATFGEDRRTVGQARPILPAAAGREPSEPAAVRGDAGADRAPAGSDGVGDAGPVCRRIGL
jgi:hypothetical protein